MSNQCSIWPASKRIKDSRLGASAVMINDSTAFRFDWIPFAGVKQSGLGVGGIPHTYRDMQVEKMLVVKSLAL